mgnify:CR=1 FL=1
MNSAPCMNCFNVISKLNIKRMIFSTDEDFKSCKTAEYQTNHVSHGNRMMKRRGVL